MSWTDDTPIQDVRFIVLDSETTSLDPRTARLITIGAVAVQGGEIHLDDAFEALLRVSHNTSAVTVHGITRDESRDGLEEPEALRRFLDYVKDGVIVGHHIGHDISTFNSGYQRNFGFTIDNRSLDTMDLTLHLERDGAFQGQDQIHNFSLDGLCSMFGVIPHDRHTAAGDAWITALIFLRLLRLAQKHGRDTLGRLAEPFVPEEQAAGSGAH